MHWYLPRQTHQIAFVRELTGWIENKEVENVSVIAKSSNWFLHRQEGSIDKKDMRKLNHLHLQLF
jgi:type IV secretory pathway ATPase VirB11/archaellum biosynthesis ATPase